MTATYSDLPCSVRAARGLRQLLAIAALVLNVGIVDATSASPRVAILLSSHKTCRVVAATTERLLREKGWRVDSIELPEGIESESSDDSESASSSPASQRSDAHQATLTQHIERLVQGKPDLIVSVGEAATTLVLEQTKDTPVAFTMVPNVLDSPLWAEEHPQHSRLACVSIDVSPQQQVDWIKQIRPQARNTGILYSHRSKQTVEAIAAAATKAGLSVTPIVASRDAFPKAIDDLDAARCDGLLMVADAQVYNLACLKRSLLWGIRQKHGVWAFSESLVKAGALAAICVDYEAVGRQTAAAAQKIAAGTKPADLGLQYLERPTTAINLRTVELLDLRVSRKVLDDTSVKYGAEK